MSPIASPLGRQALRTGKTLRNQEVNKSLKIIEQDLKYLLEEWHGYRNKANE
jgi:hypothetical protein